MPPRPSDCSQYRGSGTWSKPWRGLSENAQRKDNAEGPVCMADSSVFGYHARIAGDQSRGASSEPRDCGFQYLGSVSPGRERGSRSLEDLRRYRFPADAEAGKSAQRGTERHWRVNDGFVSTRPAEPCQLDGQRHAAYWRGADSCVRDLPVLQRPGTGTLHLRRHGGTAWLGTAAFGRGDLAAEWRRGPVHGHAAHGYQFRGQRVDALLRRDRDCPSGPGDWRRI